MQLGTLKRLNGILVAGGLVLVTFGVAGCHASFCIGSGCDGGKIYFGTSYKQAHAGGSISIVGRTSKFTLGQSVAMVANLSQKPGTLTLLLRVTRNGRAHSLPYGLSSKQDNVVASLFPASQLATLGITQAGTYSFQLLHGSKQLASGSMTEK